MMISILLLALMSFNITISCSINNLEQINSITTNLASSSSEDAYLSNSKGGYFYTRYYSTSNCQNTADIELVQGFALKTCILNSNSSIMLFCDKGSLLTVLTFNSTVCTGAKMSNEYLIGVCNSVQGKLGLRSLVSSCSSSIGNSLPSGGNIAGVLESGYDPSQKCNTSTSITPQTTTITTTTTIDTGNTSPIFFTALIPSIQCTSLASLIQKSIPWNYFLCPAVEPTVASPVAIKYLISPNFDQICLSNSSQGVSSNSTLLITSCLNTKASTTATQSVQGTIAVVSVRLAYKVYSCFGEIAAPSYQPSLNPSSSLSISHAPSLDLYLYPTISPSAYNSFLTTPLPSTIKKGIINIYKASQKITGIQFENLVIQNFTTIFQTSTATTLSIAPNAVTVNGIENFLQSSIFIRIRRLTQGAITVLFTIAKANTTADILQQKLLEPASATAMDVALNNSGYPNTITSPAIIILTPSPTPTSHNKDNTIRSLVIAFCVAVFLFILFSIFVWYRVLRDKKMKRRVHPEVCDVIPFPTFKINKIPEKMEMNKIEMDFKSTVAEEKIIEKLRNKGYNKNNLEKKMEKEMKENPDSGSGGYTEEKYETDALNYPSNDANDSNSSSSSGSISKGGNDSGNNGRGNHSGSSTSSDVTSDSAIDNYRTRIIQSKEMQGIL